MNCITRPAGGTAGGAGQAIGDEREAVRCADAARGISAALRDVPGEVRIREPADGWIGLDDLIPRAPVAHLLEYLRSSGQIVALTTSGWRFLPGQNKSKHYASIHANQEGIYIGHAVEEITNLTLCGQIDQTYLGRAAHAGGRAHEASCGMAA